ncbi:MAG TPA: 16S rRNA (guanine(966)-N(2))-methyltransferase RsmD [Candidatus Methylomirabilis sp.]|nr:16S rRNA (guanine(966)-N(2))-methyltransferase RsmD [Candidatus Methylomirabilis sp.]
MRISSGEHRGRRLKSPRGVRTRPTSEFLRQAIFNTIGGRIRGASVLDLFAGTGAVGLEALSRGAAAATFVERDRQAVASLRANLAALGLTGRARILPSDVLQTLGELQAAGEVFDYVFLDPPYADDQAARCIETLARGTLLSDNGALVAQAFHKTPLPERTGVLLQGWRRRYGESSLAFYVKEATCR